MFLYLFNGIIERLQNEPFHLRECHCFCFLLTFGFGSGLKEAKGPLSKDLNNKKYA